MVNKKEIFKQSKNGQMVKWSNIQMVNNKLTNIWKYTIVIYHYITSHLATHRQS